MTIPDEAVEAAARKFFGQNLALRKWRLDLTRAVLEAAAPYMLPVHEGVSEAEKRVRERMDEPHKMIGGILWTEVRIDDLETLLSALSSERERAERAEARAANLQMQAESWAMEARGHKSTVHEAYQAVTGATGEPGNWNGAEPIKAALAVAEARAQAAEAKVKEAVEFIDNYFQPWGAWKTAWWEGEVSDDAAFSSENALKAVANKLRALRWTETQGEGE